MKTGSIKLIALLLALAIAGQRVVWADTLRPMASREKIRDERIKDLWGVGLEEFKQLVPHFPDDILMHSTRKEKLEEISRKSRIKGFIGDSMRISFQKLKACPSDEELIRAAESLYTFLKERIRDCIMWSTHNVKERRYPRNWHLAFVIAEHRGPLSNPDEPNALARFYKMRVGEWGVENQSLLAQAISSYTEKNYDADELAKQIMQELVTIARRKRSLQDYLFPSESEILDQAYGIPLCKISDDDLGTFLRKIIRTSPLPESDTSAYRGMRLIGCHESRIGGVF